MKQTNSGLRQALEGGIDPLRPPEVRWLRAWVREGLAPPTPHLPHLAEQKGKIASEGRACVAIMSSLEDIFPALQANTKFNSRWTTDEQLLAVQGGLDRWGWGGARRAPGISPQPRRSRGGGEGSGKELVLRGAHTLLPF